MTKRIFIILAIIAIVAQIVVSRKLWFPELNSHLENSKHFKYSHTIDLESTDTITWKIGETDWDFNEGMAMVFLTFEKTPDMPGKDFHDKKFALKVKIDAHAVTENNVIADRLVQNYFLPTDEPMAQDDDLWAGWSDQRMEYFLGKVSRFPKETLYIELAVLTPDAILSKVNPRLKINGGYDSAAIGPVIFLNRLRDVGIFICLIALGFLAIAAWKCEKKYPEYKDTNELKT